MTTPHIVIIGGGFGGLYAARALRRAGVRITLLDRSNHHCFQPLLYQVATAALSATQIAAPIRKILGKQKNVTVQMAEVAAVDKARKVVVTRDDREIAYDYLIIATGAGHAYFGKDEWARHAPGLKTLDDALEIRRRVLLAFEAAEREQDPEVRRALMTFVVVGAGPTGVELAGALSEIARHTLARDFRNIDPATAEVILLEAGDRVLAAFDERLSPKARQQLEALGAKVRTGTLVTHIDESGVRIGDEHIPARTVLWAAGVAGSPLARTLDTPLDRAGRVLVEPDLSIPDHPEVFVVGDLAALEQDGELVPGVAPAAIQGGRHAASTIKRAMKQEEPKPFRYLDKGSLATIGRSRAVGQALGGRFTGLLAWLMWALIHVMFLVGFRNRLVTLLDWVWSYVTYNRGARLILTEEAAAGGRYPAIEPADAARPAKADSA